jgi:phosphatidate cytidylyltransferase
MSFLDPYGGAAAPGDRQWQPDDTVGDGRDDRLRARHAGAAPEPFAPEGWPEPYPAADRRPEEPYAADRRPEEPYAADGWPPRERPHGYEPSGPYTGSGNETHHRQDTPGLAYRPAPQSAPSWDAPTAGAVPVPTVGGRPAPTVGGSPAPTVGGGSLPDADPPAGPAADATARGARGRRRAGRPRPDPGEPTTTRAGRNLPAAIGVGVGLVIVVLGSLVWRPAFLVVIAVAASVGIWEMARAVRADDAAPPLVPLFAGGLLMTGLAWYAGPDALSLGLLVTVLAALVWRLADGPAGYQRDMTAATLIAVYVPFLLGFAVLLAKPDDGGWRVLVTLAAVVLSDTGGYAFGVFLGKHPMAPSVSPKKSWEGFGGSLVAAAVGSALLLSLLFDVALWWGALFGVALAVAAVLGDLAESMIKRDLGIKDMSNLLPGHGGLMDRLDSILFAVPVAYLLLSLFAPPA